MTKSAEGKKASKKPSQGNVLKSLVLGLLSDDKNISWPIEMRTAKLLLKKNADPNFWLFLGSKRRFLSLRHLIAQDDVIFKFQLAYAKQTKLDLGKAENPVLSAEKVGDDAAVIPPKPRSLMDFLR